MLALRKSLLLSAVVYLLIAAGITLTFMGGFWVAEPVAANGVGTCSGNGSSCTSNSQCPSGVKECEHDSSSCNNDSDCEETVNVRRCENSGKLGQVCTSDSSCNVYTSQKRCNPYSSDNGDTCNNNSDCTPAPGARGDCLYEGDGGSSWFSINFMANISSDDGICGSDATCVSKEGSINAIPGYESYYGTDVRVVCDPATLCSTQTTLTQAGDCGAPQPETVQYECETVVPGQTCDIDGDCENYNGAYSSQPATNTSNGCDGGIYSDHPSYDTATEWRWRCNGEGGGSDTFCEADKAICGDAVCNGTEDCSTCSQDCGSCATCQNNIVEPGEECDDGNSNNGDACLADCTDNTCGDGYVYGGVEECDDGNSNNGDACLNDCTDNTCGDGYVNVGVEECDDADSDNSDACLNNCMDNVCGDGYVYDGVEECDDGNSNNNDGCSSTCVLEAPTCSLSAPASASAGSAVTFTATYPTAGFYVSPLNFGDGTDSPIASSINHTYDTIGVMTAQFTVVNPYNSSMREICNTEITIIGACGNGVVDPGEECFEPGLDCVSGTACNTNTCQCEQVCPLGGDGEQCDLGQLNNDDTTCTVDCKLSYCGDAIEQTNRFACIGGSLELSGSVQVCDGGTWAQEYESCDGQCADGSECNADGADPHADCAGIGDGLCIKRSGLGCSSTCQREVCGDGIVQDPNRNGQTELCDVGRGRYCSDGTECTGNPHICDLGPQDCDSYFLSGCAADCTFGSCGDGYRDDDGVDNILGNSDDETCDFGSGSSEQHENAYCFPQGYLLGGTQDVSCQRTYCGDGIVQGISFAGYTNWYGDNEECDDGNNIDGDGCESNCTLPTTYVETGACARGAISLNDYEYDANGGGDAIQPAGSLCNNQVSFDISSFTYLTGSFTGWTWTCQGLGPGADDEFCRVRESYCGDGVTDISEGEECDGQTNCTLSCLWETAGTYDGICGSIEVPYHETGDGSAINNSTPGLCVGGNLNGGVTYSDHEWSWECAGVGGGSSVTCLLDERYCGDGITEIGDDSNNPIEECDDGDGYDLPQARNGDGCSSSCDLEPPLKPYDEYYGRCVADRLPSINSDEIFPTWWQLEPTEAIDFTANNCSEIDTTNNKWILGNSVTCDFVIYRGDKNAPGTKQMVRRIMDAPCISDQWMEFDLYQDLFSDFGINTGQVIGYGVLPINDVSMWTKEEVDEANMNTTYSPVDPSGTAGNTWCGNGILEPEGEDGNVGTNDDEECDDGNSVNGDGCSQSCKVEDVEVPRLHGEYVMQLEKIRYTTCQTVAEGQVVSSQPVPRVLEYEEPNMQPICHAPFAVVDGYFVQKGSVFRTVENSQLDSYVSSEGVALVTEGTPLEQTLNTIVQYQGIGAQYLANQFIERYEELAVQQVDSLSLANVLGTSIANQVYKLPNQNIYFYKGTTDVVLDGFALTQSAFNEAFTFVVSEPGVNLNIVGSIDKNALYIVGDGRINFVSPGEICDESSFVRGIFVANGGFRTTKTRNDRIRAEQRCNGGNLIIEGVLVGPFDRDDFAQRRRGVLDVLETTVAGGFSGNVFFGDAPEAKARDLFEICYLPRIIQYDTGAPHSYLNGTPNWYPPSDGSDCSVGNMYEPIGGFPKRDKYLDPLLRKFIEWEWSYNSSNWPNHVPPFDGTNHLPQQMGWALQRLTDHYRPVFDHFIDPNMSAQFVEDSMEPFTAGGVYVFTEDYDWLDNRSAEGVVYQQARTDKLFEGASIRIDVDTQLWGELPPAARTFLESTTVFRDR